MLTSLKVISRSERYVDFLRRWAAWVVGGALLVCLVSAGLVAQLQLKTDFAELLPSHDPSVKELRRIQTRLPGMEALIINIHSDDRAANVRFADDLVAKLRAFPPELVGLAMCNIKTERAWFEDHKGLYLSLADLEALRDRLRDTLNKPKNPFYVDLESSGESLEHMAKRLGDGHGGALGPSLVKRFPDGYFLTQDGKTAMVVVMPPGGIFHEHAGERLRNEVQKAIDSLSPSQYGIHEVGYSGDIESSLEERASLENDLVWATSLCVVLVCTVVIAFFRRARAIPLMAVPALIGTLVAYGVAELGFGYLNSSTAFLASIIVGNGINFAVIQLARYDEERGRGALPAAALTRAVSLTVRATAIAALAATISYGSLVVTQFRGFSQFGIIGGVGMVAAWLATVTVLPAVLWLLDRKKGAQPLQGANRGMYFAGPLGRLALARPRALMTGAALLTLAALLVLPRYLHDPFEYNFRNLRSSSSDSDKTGEARWYAANGEVFGRALNPLVVLTETSEQVELTRQALFHVDKKGAGAPMLDKVVTLDDLVPGSISDQQPKLPVLQEIRAVMTGSAFKALPAAKRQKLEPFIPPHDLTTVTALDLPPMVRRMFTEVDGTLGHVLLVFPKTVGYNPWDGRDMMRLSERVAEISLPNHETTRAVGTAVLFTGMIRSIIRDGPLATATSAMGVALLVIILLRRAGGGAGLVLSTLFAGMVWMLGAAAGLGLRINFLNFVALPVTLGIGVDYGINIYLRYKLEGPGRLLEAVRATGGAVALCSATTIIGYGALLVADNRGLRSFGMLAILGEVACLGAALVLMPAFLAWRESHARGGMARVTPVEGA